MLPVTIRRFGRPVWSSPLDLIRDDLEGLFGRGGGEAGVVTGAYPVDIHEDPDHVYVDAELPGFSADQVEVTFEKGVLSVVAERKHEKVEGRQQHLGERRITRVARSFALPETVDEQQIDAKLENGVLHLTLSKREEVKPRRIDVH